MNGDPQLNLTPPVEPIVTPPQLPFMQRLHPLAFASLVLIIIFIAYQVIAGGVTLIIAGGKITENNASFVRWATVVGQLSCILLPTLVLGKLRYGSLGKAFKFNVPGTRQTILAVTGVFALQQVLQVYMMAQDAIPLPPELKSIQDMIRKIFDETYTLLVAAHSPWEFLAVVFSVALVPACCEEVLFRGLVQRSVSSAIGGLGGALLTGALFGFYHLNPIDVVPLVILGCYFGYLVYRSGNVLIGISAHFFNNFVACVATYMGVRDDFLVFAPSGTITGPAILLNTFFFLVVFLASTYYFITVTNVPE